ncbi:MAG: HEPN domain-containing protein [Armatimonadetes bacterium]|nr:HEPN domain-containing protein [Armatimonadota bacterium]
MDEAKRDLVRQWFEKSSQDLFAAKKLGEGTSALFGVAAYHCQQAAEKALKAFLVCQDEDHPKIHDLGVLLNLAAEHGQRFQALQDAADRLTPLATLYRYPGANEDIGEAQFDQAVRDAEALCGVALDSVPEGCRP